MRTIFFVASLIVLALIAIGTYFWPPTLWVWVIVGPLIGLGMYDACQTQHAVLRNFPLLGHGRYLMEMIRPEVSQYFIEFDTSGRPFNREERSLVYQRAKGETDSCPLGRAKMCMPWGMNGSITPWHPNRFCPHSPALLLVKQAVRVRMRHRS